MSELVVSNPRLEDWLREQRGRVDRCLEIELRAESTPPRVVHEAMRYTVLAGGKRIRPLLAIASARALGSDDDSFLPAFCSLELIHSYSLVHDDLPSLDDDDLRRGRPTAHVVYGEAMALLAGDALLTEAFRWLSGPLKGVPAERQLRAVRMVSDAIDSTGMIGGQVEDLLAEQDEQLDSSKQGLDRLESIHRNKTGRLLTASVQLGALLAGASEEQMAALCAYGNAIGLAFQIVDDILDQIQSSEILGKTAGKDAAQGKLTYPALLGLDGAREAADRRLEEALAAAEAFDPEDWVLPELARFICNRTH